MMLERNTSKLRVAVLAGGNSAERAVSQRSGLGVVAALEAGGHSAVLVDPANYASLAAIDWSEFDACFIALHGGAGEDGRVQAELTKLGVPYTGCGPEVCRLAMSKLASKQRFVAEGVPTPPYVWIAAEDSLASVARRASALGYPLILKPDDQGSSVGVAIARESGELAQALAEARTFGGGCLAEPFIRGREFTVAMLDDRPLPLIEIVTPEQVFSYDAKYHSSLTEYRFDFHLADEVRERIVSAAVAAAGALGAQGLTRVDVMLGSVSPDGAMLGTDDQPWVLELNAIPGMTVRSLAPLAAARAGIDMTELCDLLVRRCLVLAEAM
jgi:D-alanine-D-alanine ligase